MSLQSSANADCDDKQVREREVYVSVCMCVCVCERVCVQQSVREKQAQIMTESPPQHKGRQLLRNWPPDSDEKQKN